MKSNSRTARCYVWSAVLFVAVVTIAPTAFAQAPVKVSIPGTAFTGTASDLSRSGSITSLDIPEGRRFSLEAGMLLKLTGALKMPPPGSSDQKLVRLVVHFHTSQGGPSLRSVELNNGTRKEYRFNTNLSGDYVTRERGPLSTRTAASCPCNLWTFENTTVSSQWVIGLEVQLPQGVAVALDRRDFVLTAVEADFGALTTNRR